MPFDDTLRITPELLSLIAEIDEFKGAWRALSTLAPDRLAALRRVATIESIGSSTRIEGAKLSDREVEALLLRLDPTSFRSRDEEEVAGYAEAMERVFASFADIPLTENYVKQLHAIMLRHSGKDERHRGEYKTLPNHVEAFDADGKSLGIVFETAMPFDTPRKMREVTEWAQGALAGATLHPLLVIALFTVVFLAIHPFQDGNGRLSRILTTLLLLKAGYAYVAYSSLESVIEANKEGYYLALRRTQRTLAEARPDWEPWMLFFLRALQRQKARLAEKIADAKTMTAAVPALAEKILELTRAQGRISIGDIIRATGQHRSTIKLRLSELLRAGHLARHGKGPATWYTLR